jgi:hypothetical protein
MRIDENGIAIPLSKQQQHLYNYCVLKHGCSSIFGAYFKIHDSPSEERAIWTRHQTLIGK